MRRAAFFDVDETILAFKSMFRFLAYYLADRGEPPGTWQRLAGELRAAATVLPRHEVNRRYYRVLAGESVQRVAAAGRAWFAQESGRREVFNRTVLAELESHRAAGSRIVLVSGSFFACLDPIAAAVRADHAVGTEPMVVGGRFTGEVVRPIIGVNKAYAVHDEAERGRLRLPDSHAYGDHASDLPMLQAVGNPVVVGRDPALTRHAAAPGWRVISTQLSTQLRHGASDDPAGAGSGGPVRQPEHTGGERLRAQQRQGDLVGEQRQSAAQHDRVHPQAVLVDKAEPGQRLGEPGAAGHEDVGAWSILQLRDLVGGVALRQPGVPPLDLVQRRGEDDLFGVVDQRRELVGRGRPVLRLLLVRHPAEKLRVALPDHLDGPGHDLVVDLPGQPAEVAARSRDEPVDRDGHEQYDFPRERSGHGGSSHSDLRQRSVRPGHRVLQHLPVPRH
jgi:HAD superfamily hydrolase (TIGR01490 family)